MCAITASGFVVSQAVDRFVRNRGRLGPDNAEKEQSLSLWSVFFSLLAGLALLMACAFNVI